eukprot:CAMPEP_0116848096 /NCGR_PEP_ID=MMETSP0418-20121206/14802_1 /TAXON_ID=1158023 /ORGANISM="Astrosyne radiata, Strain 13vi08-1A" /LENGTH=178 /DNA_ID=CAMNT_0004479619 /DNA_START=750 /DNA_END=1282 /DNA_ORIENTATION=-
MEPTQQNASIHADKENNSSVGSSRMISATSASPAVGSTSKTTTTRRRDAGGKHRLPFRSVWTPKNSPNSPFRPIPTKPSMLVKKRLKLPILQESNIAAATNESPPTTDSTTGTIRIQSHFEHLSLRSKTPPITKNMRRQPDSTINTSWSRTVLSPPPATQEEETLCQATPVSKELLLL